MVTVEERIARTQRLLRRLEEDRPYLRARVAVLKAEHRDRVHQYTERIRIEAEAELARLCAQRISENDYVLPQPAD